MRFKIIKLFLFRGYFFILSMYNKRMLKNILDKLKESSLSVLPVAAIVIILFFTPLLQLSVTEIVVFVISAIFLIIGIALFNVGAEMAMSPMGEQIGSSLIRSKKIKLALAIIFVMGLLITIAEPDLSVLATQVKEAINNVALIVMVGVGVAVFLVVAILKIILKIDLSYILMFLYMVMFGFACLAMVSPNGAKFIALAFDSGGVTTGPITVPFIMALGLGVAQTVGGRNSKENSFGLVALSSVGPILVVLILSMTITNVPEQIINPADYQLSGDWMAILQTVGQTLWKSFKEVALALGLITACFFVIELIFIKLPLKQILHIIVGLVFTLVGLVVFLTAATVGFMPTGYQIGRMLANQGAAWLIALGFILGFIVVLAEPAIQVLTKQVEEVTMGGVSKRQMLLALCIGVGISIGLSMVRIVFNFSILYYLIPGYLISLALSFFVPKVYTAIAFDSGGVASGPLTSSFILPMAIGACVALYGEMSENILADAFGVVAMVAMTPLIAIQVLGFKSVIQNKIRERSRTKRVLSADDEEIIIFK